MDISRAIDNLKTRYKDMEKYVAIMKAIWETDISADKNLQKTFNAFYRIRRNAAWRKEYYELFETCKQKADISFEYILREMFRRTGKIEASFSSKMLATINPAMPIWDSIVLSKLQCKLSNRQDKEWRIKEAVRVYGDIECCYAGFLNTDRAKKVLEAFDEAFPEFKDMTDVKKIDFILWGGGEENPLDIKRIEIMGIVEVPIIVTDDEFMDKFIEFIEANHWRFVGGVNEYKGEDNE